MDPRPLSYVLEATGGQLRGGSIGALVRRVSTDSRQVEPGDLFIALKGDRFDGHDFLNAAVARKPAAVLVQANRGSIPINECPVIEVEDDTRAALGRLAACYRKDFSVPLIAVAGSNGKTTTKEILHTVLGQGLQTVRGEASFNNDIGVPLSLLQLQPEHQVGVFEVGTNHPGEMPPLLRMIAPWYSVITSIGREHLEHFGSVENVAREEGWAAEVLPENGRLFINGDSVWVESIVKRTKATVVKVGAAEDNDWRVTDVRAELTGTTFNIETRTPDFSGAYRVSLVGLHQPINAAFAVALGAEFGLSRSQVESGLAQCIAPKMRLQIWEAHGVRVLDDSYNANADSMIAALRTLQALPCNGRRVAVLGDMAEQGASSDAAHLEVGQQAAALGVDQLFTVGNLAANIAKGARSAGLHRVLEFARAEGAGAAVRSFVKPGDVLLIKASRVMRLEQIGEAVRGCEGQRKN